MPAEDERDPAVLADAKALTDGVHELLNSMQDGRGPVDRIQLRIPRAWLVLGAWLYLAERDRAKGRYEPVAIPAAEMTDDQVRRFGKKWIARQFEEAMQLNLHYLSVGGHELLFRESAERQSWSERPEGLQPSADDPPF